MNPRAYRDSGSSVHLVPLVLGLGIALAACGDDAGAVPDAAVDRVDAAPEVPCTAGELCLTVKFVRPGLVVPNGRLAVIWRQLDDQAPHPDPVIAYDAPFDFETGRFDVTVEGLTPPDEVNLSCLRSCGDEAACPCMGDVAVGLGYIVVAADGNGNGALDVPDEVSWDAFPVELIGIGQAMVGYSTAEHMPAPAPFDNLWPDGIRQGIHVYDLIEVIPGRAQIGIPAEPFVYDLVVCQPGTDSCDDVPIPEIN